MWTPGAGGMGDGMPASFDDKPVGKKPPAGGMMGGGGGGGFQTQQPVAVPTGAKMRQSTAAANFYKQAQNDSQHKVAKKKMRAAVGQGAGGMPKRPNFLMCYLCGQQFGKASLPIHQPQCYMKKLVEWERGDPATRGSKPAHPDEMAAKLPAQQDTTRMSSADIDAYNDAQFQHFNDNMVSCENCGRTFFPDRLAVHQRSCRPDASGRGSKPVLGKNSTAATRPASPKPPSSPRIQSSYTSKLDPPSTASIYDQPQPGEREGSTATPLYDDTTPPPPAPVRKSIAKPPPTPDLEPCPQCGRRFVPKKMEAHMAVCKGPSPGMGTGTRTGPGGNTLPTFEDSLVPCQFCARTFTPDRVVKHEGVCPSARSGAPPPSKPQTRKSTLPPAAASSPIVKSAGQPMPSRPSVSSHGKPKFCQECGTRFTAVPKFCQECGTRVD